ncbi:hypothetical protein MNBD_GAMMA17-1135 [hydrothermal vent metagenome]|uniref:Uncharacterized protein n=1 Tax=hydrothermal vent metagenome TaxID=652676 RepID=A0A3B1A6G2_9ZZZZ
MANIPLFFIRKLVNSSPRCALLGINGAFCLNQENIRSFFFRACIMQRSHNNSFDCKVFSRMKKTTVFVFFNALLIFGNSLVIADEPAYGGVTELSAGIELFRWQEFDRAGTRLLTEQGPRARLNFSHHNERRLTSGLLYRMDASVYGGVVDYDGQTQRLGQFSAARVDYLGAATELTGGYRLVNFKWGRSLDLLAGVGLDRWSRDIGNGTSSQGARVIGYEEVFDIAFTRFSLGMEKRADIWRSLWRAGIKYPVYTNETIDAFSLELKPGKRPSLFLSYRFQLIGSAGDEGAYVKFLYDSYRFAKSDVVSRFEQPKSDMDVMSFSIGRAF